MVLRVVGCGGRAKDQVNPERLIRALDYAQKMGAKVMSFSAHWADTTPTLDAAFKRVADDPRPTPAIAAPLSWRACRTRARRRPDIPPPILPADRAGSTDRERRHNLAGHERRPGRAELRLAERLRSGRHGRDVGLSRREWRARIRPQFYPGFSQVSGRARPMLDWAPTSFWRRLFGIGCPARRAARSRTCEATTPGSAAGRRVYTRGQAKKRKRVPRARTGTGRSQ